MSKRWWGVLLGVLLALLMAAGEAQAQRTGGRFRGGGFGRRSGSSRSSGSSGSSGRSWGGSSRRSTTRRSTWGGSGGSRSTPTSRRWGSGGGNSRTGSSRRYTGRSRGFGGMGTGALCCLVGFVGLIGFFIIVGKMRKKGQSGSAGLAGGGSYAGPDAMYVNRLSLGVDWRARRELQGTLERLAQTGDTSSPEGLANLLRETVLALRRAELSWLYIAQQNLGPLSPQAAEAQFNQIAMSMRAGFQHELVNNQQVQQAPEMRAHPNEGEGTVVVHLIIAAYRPLSSMENPDANQIRMALDNRAALTASQLAVLEVVWSPAAEDDRMSSAELEQNYPDMRLIDPNSIAGRIFCSYCRGPFAMELLTCPHCGAPAEASRDNRAP